MEKFRDLLGKMHRNPSSKRTLHCLGPALLSVTHFLFSHQGLPAATETVVTCMAIWDTPDFLIPVGAGQHSTNDSHCTKPSEDSKYTFHAVNHFSCASLSKAAPRKEESELQREIATICRHEASVGLRVLIIPQNGLLKAKSLRPKICADL